MVEQEEIMNIPDGWVYDPNFPHTSEYPYHTRWDSKNYIDSNVPFDDPHLDQCIFNAIDNADSGYLWKINCKVQQNTVELEYWYSIPQFALRTDGSRVVPPPRKLITKTETITI